MKPLPHVSLFEVMTDEGLFGQTFGGPTWAAWRVVAKVLDGLHLDDEELEIFEDLTGRTRPPKSVRELWALAGRRSGKTLFAALLVVYLAAFRRYDDVLGPGERGTAMLLAADRRQASVAMSYVKGLLDHPLLRPLVVRETRESIDLDNRVTIEIHTASYRTTRGYSLVVCVADEISFWRSDEHSSEPDKEVIAAVRPALATTGGKLIAISSAYAAKGEMYRQYTRHFGKDEAEDVLVVKAATRTLNPSVPQKLIDSALEEDPEAARSEWYSEFRQSLTNLLDSEAIDRCVVPDRFELPPVWAERYVAFVDPSGGRRDSYTVAIAHREGDTCVIDAVRDWRPPFNPSAVTVEIANLLSEYRVRKVVGDRYAGEWVAESFRKMNLRYLVCDDVKSDLYLSLQGWLHGGRIELPAHKRLLSELRGLERRRGPSGRDRVDHMPGAHDDLANAVAGVSCEVLKKRRRKGQGIKF